MNIKILSAVVVLISTFTQATSISIYRWVDENNIVHFSHDHPININVSEVTVEVAYKPAAKEINKTEGQLEKEKKDLLSAEQTAKNTKIIDQNCKAAQANVKILNSFDKISITEADGTSRVLMAKEKEEQLSISEKHVDAYCTTE